MKPRLWAALAKMISRVGVTQMLAVLGCGHFDPHVGFGFLRSVIFLGGGSGGYRGINSNVQPKCNTDLPRVESVGRGSAQVLGNVVRQNALGSPSLCSKCFRIQELVEQDMLYMRWSPPSQLVHFIILFLLIILSTTFCPWDEICRFKG